jgi:hypothetical protein
MTERLVLANSAIGALSKKTEEDESIDSQQLEQSQDN